MLLFLTLLWNENLRLQLATVLLQASASPGDLWAEIAKQGVVALLLLGGLYYLYNENKELKKDLKAEREKSEMRRDGREKATEAILLAVGETNEAVAKALQETKDVLSRRNRT